MIELSIRKALAGSFTTATELHVQSPTHKPITCSKIYKKRDFQRLTF